MRDNRNGFTLIELVIVISIAGILSAVGIASFLTYNKTQEVNMAAQDLANMLNSAKSKAQSQLKPSGCADTAPLQGYKVVLCAAGGTCLVQDSGQSYAFYAFCGNLGSLVDPELENSKKLPGTISISSPTPEFYFKVLYGEVAFTGSGVVTLTGESNYSKTITVGSDGSITVQ